MLNLNEYETKMKLELERITAELKTLAIYEPETDDWVVDLKEDNITEADENIEADTAETMEERRATLSDLEIEYQNIKRALQKITENNFGKCEICHQPIEENRLNFKLTARTCSLHMNDENQLSL